MFFKNFILKTENFSLKLTLHFKFVNKSQENNFHFVMASR